MKSSLLAATFCLVSVVSFSQKASYQDQVFDSLFRIFKSVPTVEAVNNLFGRPTDTLKISSNILPGYKKYAVYFLPGKDRTEYDYCLILLQKLKSQVAHEKFVISKNMSMWELIIKNGWPLKIEIYQKNESAGFPFDRLSLIHGYDSHEFLSTPLSDNQIKQIKGCTFIYKNEKYTTEQIDKLKSILTKIKAEYACLYPPIPDFDPPPAEIIKSQECL